MTDHILNRTPCYNNTYNRTLLNRIASFGLHVSYDSGIWLVLYNNVAIADNYDLDSVLVLALEWIVKTRKLRVGLNFSLTLVENGD